MTQYSTIKVILGGVEINEYYEMEHVFKANGINAKIITKETDGDALGFGISEFIVLLPLLVPYIVEFRKIIESYLIYKKPLNNKITITLENNDKRIVIESENSKIPDIDELKKFFDDVKRSDDGYSE